MTNYIVEYENLLGRVFPVIIREEFEFMTLAQMRMIQLESYGFKPVLIELNVNSGDNNCQVLNN